MQPGAVCYDCLGSTPPPNINKFGSYDRADKFAENNDKTPINQTKLGSHRL